MKEEDTETRYGLLREVQSITAEDAINIVVAHYGMVIASKDRVKGFIFDPTAHDYKLNPDMYIED